MSYRISSDIFSAPESRQYLKKSEVNYAIANTCLKYLSSDCFDSGLGIEAVDEGIKRGVYVLQDYAASYWLDHILRGSTTSGCPEYVSRCLEAMIERRKNWTWEGSCTDCAPPVHLKILKEEAPEVFETLVYIHSFLQRRWRELSLADGKSACTFRRLYTLTQILSRKIVGK